MSGAGLRPAPRRRAIVAALLGADLRGWVREKVFFALSFAGVLIYAGVSYLLPDTVDESLRVGVRAPAGAPALLPAAPGLRVIPFADGEALRAAVAEGAVEGAEGREELLVGLDFAAPGAVTVHLSPKAPPELAAAAATAVRELAFAAAGQPLPVTLPPLSELVRGEAEVGARASLRARMRPLAALMVLGLEMLSVASLVARELQRRTVIAVLATPATALDWLLSKLLFGGIVAFAQAILLLLLIGALFTAPGQMLALVGLGTLLFTGFGLLAGARARDFTEVLFYSFLLLVPALVPAFAVLIPGPTHALVKALPTYPLAVAFLKAGEGATWAALLPYVGATAAWLAAIVGVGALALRRALGRL